MKWKEENEAVLAAVTAKLAALNVTQATTNQNLLQQGFALATAATGWWQVAVYVGIAAVVFAPITALILSATVALVSFTAGAAGMLAVLGGTALGFGVIGALVTLFGILAATGTSAGQPSPFTTLLASLGTLKNHFEEAAKPIANLIFVFANGLLPMVRTVGDALFGWFGDRLPSVLIGVSALMRNLGPDFSNFFAFLGGVADKVGPQISSMTEGFIRLSLQGAQGLITNLVRLSDWFQKELPTLGPVVAQIFGGIGTFIQGVASNWAKLNDWIVANWPQTVKDAKNEVDKLSGAFKDLADPKGQMQTSLQGFIDLGKALKTISDNVTSIVEAIGKINKALQPVADVLNSINNALNQNGLFWNRFLTAPPGAGPTWAQPPGGGNVQANSMASNSVTANITINGTNTNNAPAVANAVTAALRQRGFGGSLA